MSSKEHPAVPFLQFQNAKECKRTAQAEYNYASLNLKHAGIEERLWEMKSQGEPLAALKNKNIPDRLKMWAAAYYVVMGRLPDFELLLDSE